MKLLKFSLSFLIVIAFLVASVQILFSEPSDQDYMQMKHEIKDLKKSYRQLRKKLKKKKRTGFELPELQIRGFGHVQYDVKESHVGNLNRFTNNFKNGGVDLFITSQISRRLSFLNETLFEFGNNGANVLDVERVMLKYAYADWLNIGAGRGHTALGYWNQRFHHGTWLYTTVDRPEMYAFEDDGGILPVHFVGLEFSGYIPLSLGDLNFIANVANGRGRITDEVQLTEDDNNSKMISLMVTFEPSSLPGLGFGGNIVNDLIPRDVANARPDDIEELILGTQIFYNDDQIEWIGELQFIQHDGTNTTKHTGGYMQFAYSFGKIKPYYRYDFLSINASDSFFNDAGAENTSLNTIGVRYDWLPYSAFKLEFRNSDKDSIVSNEGTLQASFAF
jgi:hypothetical protein